MEHSPDILDNFFKYFKDVFIDMTFFICYQKALANGAMSSEPLPTCGTGYMDHTCIT